MKFLIIVSIFMSVIFADKLIIDAKKFEAYDKKGYSKFTGNVKVKRGNDRLNADKVEVILSKKDKKNKREPLRYIATGKVFFEVNTNGKEYEGKGGKVIYDIKNLKYTIIGNGYLKEKIEDKTLYGDEIYINETTGEASVKATSNKPVRFILNLDKNDDKKENKDNKSEKK